MSIRDDIALAHEIQSQAGIYGALRGTAIGLGTSTIAHYYWPLFRRQSLPFKAFLVSSFTIFGLVLGADNALLAYEEAQRHRENSIRREARIALAQQGIVPTETEIAKWKKAQNTQKI